jgi:hypothetical protein
MKSRERHMVEILRRGKEQFGYVSVKAEFEAEGTRIDELMRLVELTHKSGLELTIKVGGCEAVRDLLETRQIGARYIVAPMIETPYALSKFIGAKNLVFGPDERSDTDFLFNIETATGFKNRRELVKQAKSVDGVQGVVFGRVDYSGSLGMSRDSINGEAITDDILEVAELCMESELDLVVGGGVSRDSIDCLREIAQIRLTRFETRKIVFLGESIASDEIHQGLLNAVHFELLWLLNKQDYYQALSREDDARISMLESRWNVLQGKHF